jgi:hypothetical protein
MASITQSRISHGGGDLTAVNNLTGKETPSTTYFTKIDPFTCWRWPDSREQPHPTRGPLNYKCDENLSFHTLTVTRRLWATSPNKRSPQWRLLQKSPILDGCGEPTIVNDLTQQDILSITYLTMISHFTRWRLPDGCEPPHPTPGNIDRPYISLSAASWLRCQVLHQILASRCSGFRASVPGNELLGPSAYGPQAGQKAFPWIKRRKSCHVEMKPGLDRWRGTDRKLVQYVRRQADIWTVRSLGESKARRAFRGTDMRIGFGRLTCGCVRNYIHNSLTGSWKVQLCLYTVVILFYSFLPFDFTSLLVFVYPLFFLFISFLSFCHGHNFWFTIQVSPGEWLL